MQNEEQRSEASFVLKLNQIISRDSSYRRKS